MENEQAAPLPPVVAEVTRAERFPPGFSKPPPHEYAKLIISETKALQKRANILRAEAKALINQLQTLAVEKTTRESPAAKREALDTQTPHSLITFVSEGSPHSFQRSRVHSLERFKGESST